MNYLKGTVSRWDDIIRRCYGAVLREPQSLTEEVKLQLWVRGRTEIK